MTNGKKKHLQNGLDLNNTLKHLWYLFKKKQKKKGEEAEAAVDDGDKKEFYTDRNKTDKKIYKPMKTHIF